MKGAANRKKNFLASDSGSSDFQGPKLKRQRAKSIKVLNVAEKPGQAREISVVMSEGEFMKIKGLSVDKDEIPEGYEFEYVVGKDVYDMVFFSVEGRFKKTGFGEENYNVDDYYEPDEIFRRSMVKFVPGENKGILDMLKEQAQNNSWLYLWMDGDKEGIASASILKRSVAIAIVKLKQSGLHLRLIPQYFIPDDALRNLMEGKLHTAHKSYADALAVRQETDLKAHVSRFCSLGL